ncbi:MAG: recombination mediator RecR [Rickettsiales bacterium]|jgi:recombination protein RecR|nr:recombination mediator RecR [Rickettsiales bacterium]
MNPLIQKLIQSFAKLPSVGSRSARRAVIHLLESKDGEAAALARNLAEAMEKIRPCEKCGCLTEGPLCFACADATRANGQLCLVRDLSDIIVLEKAGVFRGRYHVLGGLLSALDGITPEDLNLKTLPARVASEKITEVISALPNTVDGKSTAFYVKGMLRGAALKFSEPAQGVPMGGSLDYIDDGTLAVAFSDRREI